MAFKTMAGPAIAAIRSHFPTPRYTQTELAGMMKGAITSILKQDGLMKNKVINTDTLHDRIDYIFTQTQVKHRSLQLNPNGILKPVDEAALIEHQQLLRETTSSLGTSSIKGLLEQVDKKFSDVSQHMFHTTSTDMIPSADIAVFSQFPLPERPPKKRASPEDEKIASASKADGQVPPSFAHNLVRHSLAPAGCVGGLSLFHSGRLAVRRELPTLLATTVEAASQTWKLGFRVEIVRILRDYDRGLINDDELKTQITAVFISAGLFGDGAASMLLVHDEGKGDYVPPGFLKAGVIYPRIIHTVDKLVPNTTHIVGVTSQPGGGVKIHLDKDLPEYTKKYAVQTMEEAFDDIDIPDVKEYKHSKIHFIIHPGGPDILKKIQKAMDLTAEDLKHSWATLNENGNCGSVSIMDGVSRIMKDPTIKEGDLLALGGVGPGLNFQGAIMRFEKYRP